MRGIARIVLAAAIASVILLGVPYYCGLRCEARFRSVVDELSKTSPRPLTLVSYQRGLFGATAETVIDVPDPAAVAAPSGPPSTPRRVILHHRIFHGPGLDGLRFARVVTTPELPDPLGATLAHLFKDRPPLTVTVDFGLDGSADGQVVSPAAATATTDATAAGAAPTQIEWAGLDGRFHLTPGATALTSHLTALRLSVQAAVGQLVLDRMEETGDQRRGETSGMWIGAGTLTVDGIRLNAGPQAFRIDKLVMESRSDESNDLMTSTTTFSAGRAGVEGVGGRMIDRPSLRMVMSNLDAAALQEIRERVQEPETQPAADVQARWSQLRGVLAPLITRLAKRQPGFAIEELSFATTEGSAKLSGEIHYVGEGSLDTFAWQSDLAASAIVDLPAALFDELAAQSVRPKVRKDLAANAAANPAAASEAALDTHAHAVAAAMRQSFIDRNLLKVAGDHVTATAELRAGVLTVNGQPMPLTGSVE